PRPSVRRTPRLNRALGSHRTFNAVPANLGHGVGGLFEVQILKRFGEADDLETLFPFALGEKARRNGGRHGGGGCRCGGEFSACQEMGCFHDGPRTARYFCFTSDCQFITSVKV